MHLGMFTMMSTLDESIALAITEWFHGYFQIVLLLLFVTNYGRLTVVARVLH